MTAAVRSAGMASAVQAAALAAPALVVLASGPATAPALLTAIAVTLVWELLFTRLRGRPASWHGVVTALAVFLFLPDDVVPWELALALCMGVVLSELIFGGRGFGFLSPAAASLAFLAFSFPHVVLPAPGVWVAIATLPGAAVLLAVGLVSWRVLLAATVGFGGSAVLIGASAGIAVTSGIVGLVFLVADPFGAASTDPGRWVYGLLTGGMVALFGAADLPAVASAAIVFATLMGNILAPLIDQLVIGAELAKRRYRHG